MSKTVLDIPKDTISGVKVMKHDLSQSIDSNTKLIDITNLIQIPQPELRYLGDDNLMVYTKGHSDEWLKYQPMLFMFRYKQKISKNKPYSGWVHPVDKDAATRWAGCNFYGGARMNESKTNPTALPGLTTEIEIPLNYNQHQGIKFPFNRYMFWRNEGDVFDQIPKGLNDNLIWHDFNTNSHLSSGWIIGKQGKVSGGSGSGFRYRKKKVQKFCFAFGIRRPERLATQLRLSPMIFGPMSDVVITMPGFSTGRNPNFQKNGIGKERGANEIARLVTVNNLASIYTSAITGYDNSIYNSLLTANDIIVKIKNMKNISSLVNERVVHNCDTCK